MGKDYDDIAKGLLANEGREYSEVEFQKVVDFIDVLYGMDDEIIKEVIRLNEQGKTIAEICEQMGLENPLTRVETEAESEHGSQPKEDVFGMILGNYTTVDIYDAMELEGKYDEWPEEKQKEFIEDIINKLPLYIIESKYGYQFCSAAFEDEPYPVGTRLEDILEKDVDFYCLSWHSYKSKTKRVRYLAEPNEIASFQHAFTGLSILRRDVFEKGLPDNQHKVEIAFKSGEVRVFDASGYVKEIDGQGFVGVLDKVCLKVLEQLTDNGEEQESDLELLRKALWAESEKKRQVASELSLSLVAVGINKI